VLLLLPMMLEGLTQQLLDLSASTLGDAPDMYAMTISCCSCCCCLGQGSGER
jgi:hypothetical protein